MARSVRSGKSARARAKLKRKWAKDRDRKVGLLRVRKPGGRMKPIKRKTRGNRRKGK